MRTLPLLLILATCAFAQESNPAELPQAPSATKSETPPAAGEPAPRTKPAEKASHRFWDKKNALLFAGVALGRGLDYTSTLNMRARGRDEILLSNWVVDNRPVFVAVQAAGVAANIGLAYLLHRTGHHKAERWVSIVHIGVAGVGTVRNYALETKRPAAP